MLSAAWSNHLCPLRPTMQLPRFAVARFYCRGQLKCNGTRAETRFRLSAKRTSPFNPLNAALNPICHLLALLGARPILHISRIRVKSAGASVLAAEVWASVLVMLDTPCSEVVWKILATHSICQFPLHFPSRASPCAITFQLESTSWPHPLAPANGLS